MRAIDVAGPPYPFVCYEGLPTDAEGFLVFPNNVSPHQELTHDRRRSTTP